MCVRTLPPRNRSSPGRSIPEILLFSRYDLGRDNVTVLPVPEVPPGILHADRRDFGLALLALLFNAAEAMSERGGELSVRVFIDAAGWGFTVSDQGPGIPAGLEEKVFEVGFTTRTGRSTWEWDSRSRGTSRSRRGEPCASHPGRGAAARRRSACR